ncbi:SRPBCC family protein [Janthinobacterium aquaticum]|uniref:SRPBCC family protein n=1 Tax=Janthinobacterium sp. FT58W TaxID=2654254 RepID=UPI0012657714|nr:SRPBCC family protein [Janthinobacterium sp. FT58W]KAB8043908.1 SRPBCC family protein [Janthinobacterium sp. FT58W]
MATVDYCALVGHAPDEVWKVLKQFGQISAWHPAIIHSRIEGELPDGMVGCVRHLTLENGAILREKLLSVDDSERRLSYRFEESPLPVDNYVATIRLTPVSGEARTLIAWNATFDLREPDPQQQQSAAIQALIVGGHASLASYLAGNAQH